MNFKLLFLIIPIFCFSQEDNYTKLNKLPKDVFEKAINDSIEKLESGELWNFLKVLRDDYNTDLKTFNSSFVKKFEVTNWSMDMHFLLKFLIDQKTDNSIIEEILNNKKEIWDKENWSENFWKIIRENKLNIKEETYYSINELGQKTYNLKSFLEEKINNNELGTNPLLFVNYKLTNYEINKLSEILEKLNIKDIQIISKNKSPELYGKVGIDGIIEILTR